MANSILHAIYASLKKDDAYYQNLLKHFGIEFDDIGITALDEQINRVQAERAQDKTKSLNQERFINALKAQRQQLLDYIEAELLYWSGFQVTIEDERVVGMDLDSQQIQLTSTEQNTNEQDEQALKLKQEINRLTDYLNFMQKSLKYLKTEEKKKKVEQLIKTFEEKLKINENKLFILSPTINPILKDVNKKRYALVEVQSIQERKSKNESKEETATAAILSKKDVAKKAILSSDPVKIIKDTVELLKKLKYKNKEQEADQIEIIQYGEKYYRQLELNKPFTHFFKAAVSTALAGLGFILGIVPGAIRGVFESVRFFGIGMVATVPYYAVKTGIEFAKKGDRLGKRLTSLPSISSTWRHLFFKPQTFPAGAINVAVQAREFVNARQVCTFGKAM